MANVVRKSGEFVYLDDGSTAQQVYSDNAPDTNGIVPTDIQSHLTSTIQTHNAVSVPATTGTSASAWFPCDGYDKLALILLNDAATNSAMNIRWSFDNSTIHGNEQPMTTQTLKERAAIVDVKAPFFQVFIANTDASAHTMSAWAYLK